MKRYFIRKIIIAKSIQEALKLEKTAEIEEIYQDFTWIPDKADPVGFNVKAKRK